MKIFFINTKLWLISLSILVLACHNNSKNQSAYLEAVNNYFANHLHYKIPANKQYYFLTSAACNSCIHPYLQALKEKYKSNKYIVICHPDFYDGYAMDNPTVKNDFIIDSTTFINTQAFMRSEICLVMSENNKIKEVTIITKENTK